MDLHNNIRELSFTGDHKNAFGFWHNLSSHVENLFREVERLGLAKDDIDDLMKAFVKLVDPVLSHPTLTDATRFEKIIVCDDVPMFLLKKIIADGRKQGLFTNEEIFSARGDELQKYAVAADYFTVGSFIEQSPKEIADEFLAQDLGL